MATVRGLARLGLLVVAWLLIAGLVVQVFLAGLGVFHQPAGNFSSHRDLGYTLSLLPILALALSLLGGPLRRPAVLSLVIFLLFMLQSVLVLQRADFPAVAALHPVNGFLITLLAIVLAVDAWRAVSAGRTASA